MSTDRALGVAITRREIRVEYGLMFYPGSLLQCSLRSEERSSYSHTLMELSTCLFALEWGARCD